MSTVGRCAICDKPNQPGSPASRGKWLCEECVSLRTRFLACGDTTILDSLVWAAEIARESEREACATLADNDPELPGPMPDKTWRLSRENAVLSLRAAVRVTKMSIAKAIRARSGT